MRTIICCAYDKVVGAFLQPQFFRTEGEAIRAFGDAVAAEHKDNNFRNHASDYSFMRVGSFDDASGALVVETDEPRKLIEAIQCVKSLDGVAAK